MTRDEVWRELLDAPRNSFVPFAGLEVTERPELARLAHASFPQGGFNRISHTRLSDDDADAVIDATIADYTSRGLYFRWPVYPGSTPLDLEARLERRGLQRTETVGMVRDTSVLPGAPSPGVTVEEVRIATDYTAVMVEGWGGPPEALAHAHRVMLEDPSRLQRLFIARVDGERAAAASLTLYPRSAYLVGGVVLPRFRKLGVYRELVRARLAVARSAGVQLAVTHAMAATSASLLTGWGFEASFRYGTWAPPK